MTDTYPQGAAAWLRRLADEVETKRNLEANSIHVDFYENGALIDSRGYHKPRRTTHD